MVPGPLWQSDFKVIIQGLCILELISRSVFRCTYVCAPTKRNFDFRRQLSRTYHFAVACLQRSWGRLNEEMTFYEKECHGIEKECHEKEGSNES